MKKAPKRKIKKVPGYIGGGTTLNYELGDPIIAAPKKKKEKSLMDKIDEGAGKVAKFGFSTAIPIAVGALAGPGAGAAAAIAGQAPIAMINAGEKKLAEKDAIEKADTEAEKSEIMN